MSSRRRSVAYKSQSRSISRTRKQPVKRRRETSRSRSGANKRTSRNYSRSTSTSTGKRKYPKASKAVRDCVSKKIPILMEEGYPQKQSVAISFSMCQKKRK